MHVNNIATHHKLNCNFYTRHLPQLPVCSYASVMASIYGEAGASTFQFIWKDAKILLVHIILGSDYSGPVKELR